MHYISLNPTNRIADDVYDPERALWRPGRRSFMFMLGAAAAGSMVPDPGSSEDHLFRDLIQGIPFASFRPGEVITIAGVHAQGRGHLQQFVVTSDCSGSSLSLTQLYPDPGRTWALKDLMTLNGRTKHGEA